MKELAPLYTQTELAEALGTTRQYVSELILKGVIVESIRTAGGKRLWTKADVDRIIEERRTKE